MRKFVFWIIVFLPCPVFALTNFPSNVDTPAGLGIAVPGQPILSAHHNNVTDAVIAVQTKVGKNNSADPTSIDYLLKNTGSVDPGHKHTGASLTNIDATTITVGTLSDARLSSNIARLNVANTWTALQTFSSGVSANTINVSGTVTASTFSGSGSGLTNIPETAITNGALLARVADNETITGDWTFTGTLTASGANITGILESNIVNGALLARVADNETITGNWTFTGTLTASGANITGILESNIANGVLLARVADNETITGNWIFTGTLTAPGANITGILESNIVNGTLLARVADNEIITGVWSFSDNIAQIRGVSYTWPAANAAGYLSNDGFGNLGWVATVASPAAGSSKQIQFNTSGSLDADFFFVWDKISQRFGVGTNVPGEKVDVVGGNIRTDGQFISTVSTGTPPLSVASTTKVTDLNVDQLDGYDSVDFPRKAENATITGIWSFSDNIAQIRGVSYTWPAANAAGVLTNNGSGTLSWSSSPAIAAGSTGYIQFNTGGALNAEANLFWDATNDRLGVRTSTPGQAIDVVSGNIRTTAQFISTVSTGTAPLSVASTTKVTNLNVDQLDGFDSVDFPRKAENATITGNWTFTGTLTASGANITGILESNITDGALLARVADNETITGIWSFSDNIAQIRGVSYTWPVANAAGVLTNNGSGTLSWSSSPAIAAGSTGYIQFNTGGALNAEATLFWDATNDRLGIGTLTPAQKVDVVGGNIRTGGQFISTVTTGTPPLGVASTTKVNNLNVDQLDGFDATDFPRKAENATITGSWVFNTTLVNLTTALAQFVSGTNSLPYYIVLDTTHGTSDPYIQWRLATADITGTGSPVTVHSLGVSGDGNNSWSLNIRITGYQYAPSIESHYAECTALYLFDGSVLTLKGYSCPVNLLGSGVSISFGVSGTSMTFNVTQTSGQNIRWFTDRYLTKGVR